MKLTLKFLIDFRSWLGENHNMKLWQLQELPEFVQNAYYMEFFIDNGIIIEVAPSSEDKMWRLFEKRALNYIPLFQWHDENQDDEHNYDSHDFNSVLDLINKEYNNKFQKELDENI